MSRLSTSQISGFNSVAVPSEFGSVSATIALSAMRGLPSARSNRPLRRWYYAFRQPDHLHTRLAPPLQAVQTGEFGTPRLLEHP